MKFKAEETTAVIVDVQERLFPHMQKKEELEKNLLILIKGLHILEVPVLVTQQYTRGLGATIASIREQIRENDPIEKIAFSCCGEPGFIRSLESTKRKCVVLAGIESHVCVLQTSIDLADKGYSVCVIEDCASSRKGNDKRIAMERMREEGVRLSTYESILFELCYEAGTDRFKAMSRLIK